MHVGVQDGHDNKRGIKTVVGDLIMKSTTRAVVIGGGIAGCSALYHLTREGWNDVVLIERDELTSGTTWHSAGMLWRLRPGEVSEIAAPYLLLRSMQI